MSIITENKIKIGTLFWGFWCYFGPIPSKDTDVRFTNDFRRLGWLKMNVRKSESEMVEIESNRFKANNN